MKFRFRFSLRTFLIAVTIIWPVYLLTWRVTDRQGIPALKEHLVANYAEQVHTQPGFVGYPDQFPEYAAPAPFLIYGERTDVTFSDELMEQLRKTGKFGSKELPFELYELHQRQWFVWCFGFTFELPLKATWRKDLELAEPADELSVDGPSVTYRERQSHRKQAELRIGGDGGR